MTTDGHNGHIGLSLPADSRYVRLARLVASGVASTCGLPLEELEDFRITVDEVCATLIELGDGEPVELSFELRPGVLVVRGTTRATVAGQVDDARLALSGQILDVVADGHDIHRVDGAVEFVARKRLRAGGVG
jgi:anti-sigma regulatory factor (Ser/Thr protein kinase)